MRTPPPAPATPSSLTDAELDAMRQVGDDYADGLAAQIFGASSMNAEPGSRLGYNKLVDIADLLETDSELLLVHDSKFAKSLGAFPKEFQNYYVPMKAPSWVDVTKLELASELWKMNSLTMLGILYAASLPACYLMKNGIPALYQTAKLKDSKYVFQRIYETGLMLDAVMSPGGLQLIQDVMTDADNMFCDNLGKAVGGNWEQQGDTFVKVAGGFESAPEEKLPEKEAAKVQEAQAQAAQVGFRVTAASQSSYLWGRGYIAAKKVRMLHASMRFMLLNPGVMQPRGNAQGSMSDKFAQAHGSSVPWPSAEIGVPVNQEDLAFTLLTFSYLIPRGLELIGCEVSLAEKEAFLHLWRVVGHVMGLRDELMTDNWDEAQKLYDRIHRLQAGSSPDGIALTKAVMGFLKTYLPNAFGISERVPVALIGAQMGPDAKLLFGPEDIAILESPRTRLTMALTRFGLRCFYRHYQRLLRWFPVAKRVFGNLLFRASEELVLSWRDEYTRKPFYVPVTLNTWQLQRGVDDAFRAKLHGWRQHLFIALGSALAAMALMFVGTTLGAVFWLLGNHDAMQWSFIAAAVLAAYSIFEMDLRIPAIFASRPTPSGVSTRGK